jgi:ABC-type nitrate/sulfonate/bicarbonate transport system substrate-binding protein
MVRMTRLIAGLACAAVAMVGTARAADLIPVEVHITRDSPTFLMTQAAAEAGIYKKHGIDLQVKDVGYAALLAELPAHAVGMSITYPGMPAVSLMNKGRDLVALHGVFGLQNSLIVKKDAPFKTVADLKGKKIGVFSLGSSAFAVYQTLALEMFGVNLKTDVQSIEAPPPVLRSLLDKGEIDGMMTLSGQGAAALGTGNYRILFDAQADWIKKTGEPLVWSSLVVAWRDWIDQDRNRAKNLIAAVEESELWCIANADMLVDKYPQQLDTQTPEAAKVMKDWLKNGQIFVPEWNQKLIDSQWNFLTLAKEKGVLDAVPDKATHAMDLLHENK